MFKSEILALSREVDRLSRTADKVQTLVTKLEDSHLTDMVLSASYNTWLQGKLIFVKRLFRLCVIT